VKGRVRRDDRGRRGGWSDVDEADTFTGEHDRSPSGYEIAW